MPVEIREARAEDAAGACEVLRRSITALCVEDHGNDPAVLARWLGNKTPTHVAAWIAAPDNGVLLAVAAGTILAVGSVTAAGRIGLNYVAPEARFRGVSKALLRALEDRARAGGSVRCTLESTATARRFYRAAGYVEDGPPIRRFGAVSYPMAKPLAGGPAPQ